MTTIKNDRFLRALAKQPVDATPIWIMRQAGRYLPEYRDTRTKATNFLTLCKTPELACEVTLQPLKRFDLDAAIIFSDILTIPDAMGLGLFFEQGEGPRFHHPIRTAKEVSALPELDLSHLSYVTNAINLVQRELSGALPLIGFAGSPWTLATYMVEGGGSKHFHVIKKFLFTEQEALALLLHKLTIAVSQYLEAQILAGANALMLFDTWGGILTTDDYYSHSLEPMRNIVTYLKERYPTIPIILFTKNGGQWLELMQTSGADALGLDWTIDIGVASKRIRNSVTLQGNMDPAVLYASPDRIRQEVQRILSAVGPEQAHIFNLGHGIHPDIPPDNVKILVDAVHELSKNVTCTY